MILGKSHHMFYLRSHHPMMSDVRISSVQTLGHRRVIEKRLEKALDELEDMVARE
jgi:hypothetical protein